MNNYDKYMHGVHDAEQKRLEIMAKMLGGANFLPPIVKDMRIIEFGSGTGAILREVAQMAPNVEAIGIDREAAQISTAKQLAAEQGLTNIRFIESDIMNLEWKEALCDAAYCRYVLEHVPDPILVVKKMSQTIRPGGWVCAYEWINSASTIFPACPTAAKVWSGIYQYQNSIGGCSAIADRLADIFIKAGFNDHEITAHPWVCTAKDKERLSWYVSGAIEIIDQTSKEILRKNFTTQDAINKAKEEYNAVLEHPGALLVEVMCRAIGRV
ncbi:MAG: class I SAM-dependent methyltransferase [Gammaproteobacteria bacterium]|nr:class I SAM-dependent methyltransferase [Gammaproteobacteria bacterium]